MKRALILSALCLPLTVAAETTPWSGDAALGFLASSGNSESTTLNSRFSLVYSVAAFKNTLNATAIFGKQESVRSVERYKLGNQFDLNLTEQDYAFLALEGEKDLFGGVRERTSQAVGYGRRILTGPVHSLNAEIGAGARQLQQRSTLQRERDAIVRLSGNYAWVISPTSTFKQSLKIESGEDNTFTETVSELKLNVVGNVFAGLSFTLRNNSEVPATAKKTDTFTAVNLSYKFGG